MILFPPLSPVISWIPFSKRWTKEGDQSYYRFVCVDFLKSILQVALMILSSRSFELFFCCRYFLLHNWRIRVYVYLRQTKECGYPRVFCLHSKKSFNALPRGGEVDKKNASRSLYSKNKCSFFKRATDGRDNILCICQKVKNRKKNENKINLFFK